MFVDLLVFSMPAEIFYFFISELRAKVQDGCKDLATISERRRTDDSFLGVLIYGGIMGRL